jgi:uncharacterized protein
MIIDGRSGVDVPPQVVVRGEAVLTVPTEVAELMAVVRVSARDRQTALERCRARSDDVARAVAAAGDAVETSDTAAASVHVERYDQGPGTPVATVQTRIVLGRPEAAGNLVAALGELDDVMVEGPWWRLRPESQAPEEARLAAIDDAVRRARLYAGAFGAEITGLVEITDAGLTRPGRAGFGGETGGVALLSAGGPRLELTPQEQRVYGSVEVRFTISPPDPEVFRR